MSFIVTAQRQILELSALTEIFTQHELSCLRLDLSKEENYIIIHGTVEGSWDKIARTEIALNNYASFRECTLKVWRSQLASLPEGMPYILDASFVEDTGQTLSYLTYLFKELDIVLENMSYQVDWLDPLTKTKGIARIQAKLEVPFHLNIHMLRERFYNLCESLNVDGSLELHQH